MRRCPDTDIDPKFLMYCVYFFFSFMWLMANKKNEMIISAVFTYFELSF